MKIAIITYQVAHQKTQDVLMGLLMQGYKEISLLAIPFIQRPEREVKYQHRFMAPYPLSPQQLADNLSLECIPLGVDELEGCILNNKFDKVIIAGAGLLPEQLTKSCNIINAHPGYLPKVKGLDSLKWALLNEVEEIAVTTHFISDKADEGILIDRKIVPLYKEDSFHSFALRQYQIEIKMLVDAVSTEILETTYLMDNNYKATMRMPIRLEEDMMRKFEERRKRSKSMYE